MVAERRGAVVGSIFLHARGPIAGIGPLTVRPDLRDRGVGRRLMEEALRLAAARRFPGVRLTQDAYHPRSLALYAKLGFAVRESPGCMGGDAIGGGIPGYAVRAATAADRAAGNRLCVRVHGHDCGGEWRGAIAAGTATVVGHHDRVTDYATAIGYTGHAVGEGDEDLKALVTATTACTAPGILVPPRDAAFFRWRLGRGLRLEKVVTLLGVGLYGAPAGASSPSVISCPRCPAGRAIIGMRARALGQPSVGPAGGGAASVAPNSANSAAARA